MTGTPPLSSASSTESLSDYASDSDGPTSPHTSRHVKIGPAQPSRQARLLDDIPANFWSKVADTNISELPAIYGTKRQRTLQASNVSAVATAPPIFLGRKGTLAEKTLTNTCSQFYTEYFMRDGAFSILDKLEKFTDDLLAKTNCKNTNKNSTSLNISFERHIAEYFLAPFCHDRDSGTYTYFNAEFAAKLINNELTPEDFFDIVDITPRFLALLFKISPACFQAIHIQSICRVIQYALNDQTVETAGERFKNANLLLYVYLEKMPDFLEKVINTFPEHLFTKKITTNDKKALEAILNIRDDEITVEQRTLLDALCAFYDKSTENFGLSQFKNSFVLALKVVHRNFMNDQVISTILNYAKAMIEINGSFETAYYAPHLETDKILSEEGKFTQELLGFNHDAMLARENEFLSRNITYSLNDFETPSLEKTFFLKHYTNKQIRHFTLLAKGLQQFKLNNGELQFLNLITGRMPHLTNTVIALEAEDTTVPLHFHAKKVFMTSIFIHQVFNDLIEFIAKRTRPHPSILDVAKYGYNIEYGSDSNASASSSPYQKPVPKNESRQQKRLRLLKEKKIKQAAQAKAKREAQVAAREAAAAAKAQAPANRTAAKPKRRTASPKPRNQPRVSPPNTPIDPVVSKAAAAILAGQNPLTQYDSDDNGKAETNQSIHESPTGAASVSVTARKQKKSLKAKAQKAFKATATKVVNKVTRAVQPALPGLLSVLNSGQRRIAFRDVQKEVVDAGGTVRENKSKNNRVYELPNGVVTEHPKHDDLGHVHPAAAHRLKELAAEAQTSSSSDSDSDDNGSARAVGKPHKKS